MSKLCMSEFQMILRIMWRTFAICHVGFDDAALKGIVQNGLNDFLSYLMPESNFPGTLSKYIDYARLLTRLSFTVGFADKVFV